MARKRIVKAKEHKIRDEDNLKSLAEGAGITWQELAIFNWGTDDPGKINKHLRSDVGCYKFAPDGKINRLTYKPPDPGGQD